MSAAQRLGVVGATANLLLLSSLLWAGGTLTMGSVIFVALAALFAYAEASAQVADDRAGDAFVAALLTGLAMLAVFGLALLSARPAPLLPLVGASTLVTIGIALRRSAMRNLGAQFQSSVRCTSQASLRTTGLHGVLRHPSDLGLLLISLGACALCWSAWALALWAGMLVPIVVFRLRREDQELRQHYGLAYQRYASQVPALLPRLQSADSLSQTFLRTGSGLAGAGTDAPYRPRAGHKPW